MEFTVNPDQFTMLDLGSLKYVDHFQHNSRYSMPWKERLTKIRENWRQIDRTPAVFLHPLFRQLKNMKKRPRRAQPKLTRAQKLIRRARKWRVLPRNIRPFMCSRCGLGSFSLRTVKNHDCRRRKYKPHTREELERVAAFGTRSGVRSAIRALEMSDSGIARIPTVSCVTHFELEEAANPAKNPKLPTGFGIRSKLKLSTLPVSSIPSAVCWTLSSADSSTTAFRCCCGFCFSGSADFDRHLNLSPTCAERNEIKFLVKNFKKFGPEGAKLAFSPVDQLMRCAACGQVDFRSSTDFHRHVIMCAAKNEEPLIEPPVLTISSG